MKHSENSQYNITCVVTVTYGDRFKLLQRVVSSALENGVGKVIIVNNGSATKSSKAIQNLELTSSGKVSVVTLPENRGSAAGYKTGLKYALKCTKCEYVWLLDDDNRPAEGALEELFNQYSKLNNVIASDILALASMRKDWKSHKEMVQGVPPFKVFPRKSSFMWFHLLRQPRRVLEKFHLDWTVKKASGNWNPD